MMTDGSNYVIVNHNVADRTQVDKVIYAGTNQVNSLTALVKLLKGANQEIFITTGMPSLAGVTTATQAEVYITTNLTTIDAAATLMERQ
jgi:precorrin-6x reductase